VSGHLVLPANHGGSPALVDDRKGRITLERGIVHPRLNRRAAPGAVDEADGHTEFLRYIAGEEIADGRELAGGGGLQTTQAPRAVSAGWAATVCSILKWR